jgi:hypothetical protein
LPSNAISRTLADQIEDLLINFRYVSSTGRGERGLMPHHIEALKQALLPFIQPIAEKAWMYDGLNK